jgi:hypothetical protein
MDFFVDAIVICEDLKLKKSQKLQSFMTFDLFPAVMVG